MFGTPELLIWDWLTSYPAANPTKKPVGIFNSDDLLNDDNVQTSLHITIDVDDSFECDTGTDAVQRHSIRCGRTDTYALSNAAAGTLEDLARVREAITQLKQLLNATLEDKSFSAGFYQSYFYAVVYKPLDATRKYMNDVLNEGVGGKATPKAVQNLAAQATNTSSKTDDNAHDPSGQDITNALASIEQLHACFNDEGGNGMKLEQNIQRALRRESKPWGGKNGGTAWIRNLPQRVGLSNFSYLFKAGQQDSTQHIDVTTLSGIVREYTGYHDATQALGVAMHSGDQYLRRKMPHWEARSATRVMLLLGCTYINEARAPHHREGDACFSTLSITTPVDIQFAGAVSRLTDESLRCIRFVIKRAQQKCDKSLLEALGLKNTNEDLLVCQVFGDLWAEELVTLHQYDQAIRLQMEMLEQASRRAAARLRSLGTLLLEVFTVLGQAELGNEGEDEVAPEIADISFRATLAGRDAARMLGRMLFARDDFEVRSVMTPVVRRSAAAAVRIAGVFERVMPERLPHEPLASLFGDRSDCVAALIRAEKLLPQNQVAARSAIVAAYASSRLVSDEESDEWKGKLRGTPQPPWRDTPIKSVTDMRAAMRYRMASLRVDYDVLSLANDMDSIQVDGLATELAQVPKVGYAFYVPFGFGDARPAPTLPPCSVPMFGTVPVLGRHLHQAFTSIQNVFMKNQAEDDQYENRDIFCVRIEPSLRCVPHADHQTCEETTAHPNIVHVFPVESPLEDGKLLCDVKVRFLASASRSNSSPKDYDDDDDNTYTYTVRALASKHLCDAGTLEMTHEVSSIAWNAERVLQSIVAALASARDIGDDMKAIAIDLHLPSFTDYAESWSNNRFNEKTDKPRRDLQRAKYDHENAKSAQLYAKSILDTLEGYTTEYDEKTQIKIEAAQVGNSVDKVDARLDLLRKLIFKYESDRDAIFESHSPVPSNDKELLQLLDTLVKERAADEKKAEEVLRIAEDMHWTDKRNTADRASRMLIGAVGVGMAMAAALVYPKRVYLRNLSFDANNGLGISQGVDMAVPQIAAAFESCDAVRMSEACIAISQWW